MHDMSSTNSSQRDAGYNGGIQPGTSATTEASSTHERALRAAVKSTPAHPGLVWRPGYSGEEISTILGLQDLVLQGVQPDGGVWADVETGLPVLAAEAKKQGEKGNAIERWYKNWDVLSVLGVRRYVTFCVGDGFFDQNSAQKALQTAVALHDARPVPEVWNTPSGKLWMYRYRTPEEAAADMPAVLSSALSSL